MSDPSHSQSNRARWCALIDLYLLGTLSAEEALELEAALAAHREAREDYRRRCNLDSALQQVAGQQVSPTRTPSVETTRWHAWRPLSAAAAGLVFGMLCTSVVFGFVTQRVGAVKKVPLAVYDPGLETRDAVLDDGLPSDVGQWGADSAQIVPAENGVSPQEGSHMMRLEPIPREKNVKNLASRVYQVIDLRARPAFGSEEDVEVEVTASFCSRHSEVSSRYLIRTFALDEAPEQATDGFWSKTEDDGVVSLAQRFDSIPGERGWHTFSQKMSLPRGAKTLVLILGAVPPEPSSEEASVHYLDDVQVSLLTPESPLPPITNR